MGITDDLAFLQEEFLREAKVIDATRGYISVSSFNLRMNPAILQAAARIISHHYKDTKVNIIHGIPHAGHYLATAIALEFGNRVKLHASRKDQHIPTSWKDVYHEEVQSFTTSSGGAHVFAGINLSFVQKGDRVLIVDDVCATGETGCKIVSGLLNRGVTVVGFAVLFDKVFQEGLAKIASLDVRVFSCVRITQIGDHDHVILEHTSQ